MVEAGVNEDDLMTEVYRRMKTYWNIEFGQKACIFYVPENCPSYKSHDIMGEEYDKML